MTKGGSLMRIALCLWTAALTGPGRTLSVPTGQAMESFRVWIREVAHASSIDA